MKWRLAKINGDADYHFVCIQFEDYTVTDYRRDWRTVYAELIKTEEWSELTQTGNRFGKWRIGIFPA